MNDEPGARTDFNLRYRLRLLAPRSGGLLRRELRPLPFVGGEGEFGIQPAYRRFRRGALLLFDRLFVEFGGPLAMGISRRDSFLAGLLGESGQVVDDLGDRVAAAECRGPQVERLTVSPH